MSRLGVQPTTIPSGVEATFAEGVLTVKGPKGELKRTVTADISITIADGTVAVAPAKDTNRARALWGTFSSHVKNMIVGVTEGFEKQLEVEGVGFRADAQGNKLVLNVGYSHPVELTAPEGVAISVEKNLITVSGIDKEAVGQFAANVRAVRKPEPYKGKGIHYVGEYIIRKQGKRAVA
jgi:large subunit ribosomal protein L6